MNSKNQMLSRLGRSLRAVFISLLALSFMATTPTHAAGQPNLELSSIVLNGGNLVPLETGRTYTITVSNVGDVPTNGDAMVVFSQVTAPAGLTVTNMAGAGWTCTLSTCTRSDFLNNGESYPVITVTVTVLVSAPPEITNQAVVSGSGDDDDTSNLSNLKSVTSTVNAKADLRITSYELRNADKSAVITAPTADETFWVRMTIENQGGIGTGNFYPGVYLDDKPNYGPDHDSNGVSIPGYPVTLALGETTDYQGYKVTDSSAQNGAGCVYYDPNNLVDPTTTEVLTERGNYHPFQFLPGLAAGASSTYDVEIAYPLDQYGDTIYENIRTGLSGGTYSIYLYADTNCLVDEVIETNNSFTNPVAFDVGNPAGPTVRMIVPSTGSQDGWVLESSETSEAGGTVDTAASVMIVGDDASDRQYRSVLSFNTSGLPDTAVVTQASLAIRVNEIVGYGNPLKMFNYFMADVRGGWFGSTSSLVAQDFKNGPAVTAGPLGQYNNGGGWLYINLKTGNTAINRLGLTQIRLRYSVGDNDNGTQNILKFYSGNYATVKHRPQLNVWYFVP